MLVALLSTASFIGLSLAATCYGTQGDNGNTDVAWALRQAICGDNACASSDSEQGNNHYCEMSIPYDLDKQVTMQRNDPTGAYPNCWAAYQDIIGQCFSGASVSPTDNPNGSWSWGDEWYWITFNNTVPVIGEDAADEEYLVNQNGSRGSETLEGPSQFCQGYSPGGGDSCVTIPAGCRIQVPLDNTVPTVDCSAIPADA